MHNKSAYQRRREAIEDGEWSDAQEREYQEQRKRERDALFGRTSPWVRKALDNDLPAKELEA